MLSDRGIKDAIRRERLIIDPFDETNLGPCSYDLTMERAYRLRTGVSFQDIPFPDEMEKFLERYCEPYNGIFLDGCPYIGVSRERVLSFLSFTTLTTRSSAARLGIEVNRVYPFDRGQYFLEFGNIALKPMPVYFGIMTYVPMIRVPEGAKIAQMSADLSFFTQGKSFYELFGRVKSDPRLTLLSGAELEKPLQGFSPKHDAVVLHQGNTVRIHNGNVLTWGENNDRHFSEVDITRPYPLSQREFCIVPSAEDLEIPHTHVGVLREMRYYDDERPFIIHPNAPFIAPGSKGNQIFEIWHYHGTTLRTGDKISILTFHTLDQEPEKVYEGKYKGQKGPQISLSHLDHA